MKKYYLKIGRFRIRVTFLIYRVFYRFNGISTEWETNNLIGTKTKNGINSEIKRDFTAKELEIEQQAQLKEDKENYMSNDYH